MLEYYGRNSLIVLALHFPMKDILTKLSNIIFEIDLDCFGCTTSFALILTGLNLLGLMPVIFIINKYFPSWRERIVLLRALKVLKFFSGNLRIDRINQLTF